MTELFDALQAAQAAGLDLRLLLESKNLSWGVPVLLLFVLQLLALKLGWVARLEAKVPSNGFYAHFVGALPNTVAGLLLPVVSTGDADFWTALGTASLGLLFGFLRLPSKDKSGPGPGPLSAGSLLVIAVLIAGCSTIKPIIRDANRAAALLLCGEVFGERYGISAEDAQRIYCDSQAILQPFLDSVQEARDAAAPVALQAAEAEK